VGVLNINRGNIGRDGELDEFNINRTEKGEGSTPAKTSVPIDQHKIT